MIPVTIHSNIAIKAIQSPSIRLWYVIRGLDSNGSGMVRVTLEYLKEVLGVSKASIYRYLGDSRLFRYYHSSKGNINIYYSSILKVCSSFKITSLGTCGYGVIEEDIVEQAIQISAIGLQKASFYAAMAANKTSSIDINKTKYSKKKNKLLPQYNPSSARYPIVNPIECFFDSEGTPHSPSVISPGVLEEGSFVRIAQAHSLGIPAGIRPTSLKSRDYKFLCADSYVMPYGGSVKTIARKLDISISTVKRYISSLPKVRMAYKTTWWHYKKALFEASENWGESLETGFVISEDGDNKQIFKWGTNLYYPLYTLTSSRRLSSKLSSSSSPPSPSS